LKPARAGEAIRQCSAPLMVAVELFLAQRIKFADIARLVEQTLKQHKAIDHPGLEEIMTADAWAREKVTQLAAGDNPC